MEYLKQEFKDFLKRPYSDDGNLFDWFLFIGMLTAMTILWTRVIKRLVD